MVVIKTDESLKKLSKTDFVVLEVNLQDKMETMKSNLNEKVSNHIVKI